MLNVNPVLARLDIRSDTVIGAVQDIRRLIESATDNKRIKKCSDLVKQIVDVTVNFENEDVARITTLAMIEAIVKNNGEIDNPEELMNLSRARAEGVMSSPALKWLFVKAETSVDTNEATSAVASGIELKVAVNVDGSIKKGGKEPLALALYKLHVLETTPPANNQEFIKILIKELGMTKSGATTYAYNCKKKLGAPPGMEIKPKK